MNRFKPNPLSNLRHVKEVTPPKTGRARRRETGEIAPPPGRRREQELQSIADRAMNFSVDHGGPEGDRSVLVVVDSLSQMIAEEIRHRTYEPDTREAMDARMESIVRAAMVGMPAPIFIRGPGVAERAFLDGFRTGPEDRIEFSMENIGGSEAIRRHADYILSISGPTTGRDSSFTEMLRPRREREIHGFAFDLETHIDPENLRRAIGGVGHHAARASESLQSVGRGLRQVADEIRRVPFDTRLRNYPIQSAAAEMMQMDFGATELRALANMEVGPVTMDELREASRAAPAGSLLSAEVVNGFIDNLMSIPRRVSFMEAMRRAEAKKKIELNKPPHPDAGKVINRPRRSVAGIMVEDVRNADGSVSRRPRTTDPK